MCVCEVMIRGEPPSYHRRGTILISSPLYQQTDISVCSECRRTNQFTNLHHQTSQERPDWLLCPIHVRSDTHAFTHSQGTLFILKVKSCWEAEAPHWWPDGVDTTRPIVHTCWSVPRRGLTAAHKANAALNHQCISMRGSHRLCLCVWDKKCSWGGGL